VVEMLPVIWRCEMIVFNKQKETKNYCSCLLMQCNIFIFLFFILFLFLHNQEEFSSYIVTPRQIKTNKKNKNYCFQITGVLRNTVGSSCLDQPNTPLDMSSSLFCRNVLVAFD